MSREPPVPLEQRYRSVTGQVAGLALHPVGTGREWPVLLLAGALLLVFAGSTLLLLWRGVGIWALDRVTVWGIDIASYVWWIGLGNAGAVISAMLLLLGQNWRTALNRLAETMTLFSALTAGLFPILHLGRPGQVYWVFPVRVDDLGLWPQFRSPLAWDAFAVATYLGVIFTFWYVGMIPDLATLRDRARSLLWRRVYGVLCLGWRGEASHWVRWRIAYRTIAAVSLPYVLVIHGGVALLLAGGPVVGWHTTIFPALFMIGGTLAGFAVVALLAVLLRTLFGLARVMTPDHLDILGRIILGTALAFLYCNLTEVWTVLYRHDPAELALLRARWLGAYAVTGWIGLVLSIGAAQLLWFRSVRRSPLLLALLAGGIAMGIYIVHYMLLVSGLGRGHFPAEWLPYAPNLWEYAALAGSFGLFLGLLLLALRTIPLVAVAELKAELREGDGPQ